MGLMWLKRIAALATGALLAACAPTEAVRDAEAPGGHPALWKVADADTTIYLFGTFHALPQGQAWRTPAFDAALAASDELLLEVPNLDDPAAVGSALMKAAVSPGLPPLVERVPAERRAALQAFIAESGIPEAALDRFETWAAGLMLAQVTFKRLGLSPDQGVEKTLQGPWKATGKPVRGLETIEEQFGFFDHLSEDAQRTFLLAVLDSPEQAKKQMEAMLKAWSIGDVAGIARTFDDETLMSAELRETLMTRRNAKWADWLKKRMARPGTVFVAVGAGHLAGNDSVQRMLAAEGVKAVRLQ